MKIKHKLFGRFVPLSLLLVYIVPLFAVVLMGPMPKAYAATTYTPEEVAAAWNAGLFVSRCAESTSWYESYNSKKSDGDLKKGALFTAGDDISVPRLLDPSDGNLRCSSDDDTKIAFKALGLGPYDFMVNVAKAYKLNSDKTGFEIVDSSKTASTIKSAIQSYAENKFGFKYSGYNGNMPGAAQYASARSTFDIKCRGSETAGGEKVKIVDTNGDIKTKEYILKLGANDVTEVGYGLAFDGGNDKKMACQTIVKVMDIHADDYSKAVKAIVAAGGTVTPPATTTSGATAQKETCESTGGALGWLLCPVIKLLSNALNAVDEMLIRLLIVDRDKYTSDDLYKVWAQFRNIALILLVPIALVMVMGTALGISALDAYTVKKTMPRLLIAVVFISLSWYICIAAIDFFNVLGQGVLGIMTAPFNVVGKSDSLASLFSPGASSVFQIGAAGLALGAATLTVGALGIIASWIGTGLLVMLLAFVILIARQLIIVVALLAAPVAILSWIFPSNNKLWKLWWETFSKVNLMFPMVMALLAAGRIFAGAVNVSGGGGAEGWLLDPLMKLTAYILPYAMIPFTFKAAGGVFSSLTGMVNDRSKGAFDRLRKGRQEGMKQIGHNMKSGRGFRGGENVLNRRSQQLAHINKAGLRPSMWGSNIQSAINTTEMQEIAKAMEDPEYAPIKGDDTLNRAIADWAHSGSMDARDLTKLLQARGYGGYDASKSAEENAAALATINRSASYAMRMRRKMSGAGLEQMAVGQAIAGGTEYTAEEAWEAAARASHGDQAALAAMVNKGRGASMNAGRVDVGGNGFGATLAYANALGKLDKSSPTYEQDKAKLTADFKRGVLESQGAGTLVHPQMKASAIEEMVPAMQERLQQAFDSGDQDAIDRELAMISSVHDSLAQTAPNKARIIADKVLRWKPGGQQSQQNLEVGQQGPVEVGGGPTIQEAMESRRNVSSVFQSTHKEYTSAFARDAAGGPVPTGSPGAGIDLGPAPGPGDSFR